MIRDLLIPQIIASYQPCLGGQGFLFVSPPYLKLKSESKYTGGNVHKWLNYNFFYLSRAHSLHLIAVHGILPISSPSVC